MAIVCLIQKKIVLQAGNLSLYIYLTCVTKYSTSPQKDPTSKLVKWQVKEVFLRETPDYESETAIPTTVARRGFLQYRFTKYLGHVFMYNCRFKRSRPYTNMI